MKGKKANTGVQVITIIVVVFAIALFSYIGKLMLDDLNTDIQNDSEFSNDTKVLSASITTRYPTIFDSGVVLLLSLFWVALLISAYLIDTEPVFMIVSVVVIIIAIVVGIALSQTYGEMMTDAEFSGLASSFPMTNFILNNLVKIILVMAFSVAVVLYGKTKQ